MKRLLLVPFLLLTALAVPVTVAAPAHAKGATKVVVEGPGMEPMKLRLYTRRTDDVDLGSLSEVTGIYGIFGSGQYTEAPDLTEAELGPRYVLTWYQASEVMAVSHVYPFAEGGAWTVVPDGQLLWGEPIQTGWWHGGTPLGDALVKLGATPPGAADPTGVADSAAETSDDDPGATAASSTGDSSTGSAALTGVLAACVAALLAVTGWLVRRRRSLQPA
jgi:LPXTG-motif cell wall-anchored protein